MNPEKPRLLQTLKGLALSWTSAIWDPEPSKLQELLDETNECEAELVSASQTFENCFLLILETLEEFRSISESLRETSAQLLESASGDDNPINTTGQSLSPYLDFIGQSAESFETLIVSLNEDSQRIEGILRYERSLEKTFSQLTYVRTLFAVESAPLEEAVRVMFSSLVDEIHRLQTDVSGIFTKHFANLRQHKALITTMSKRLETQAANHSSVSINQRQSLDSALEQMKLSLGEMSEGNELLNKHSQLISNAIASAIISLQTQDIVSQKLQHIYEISAEMRDSQTALHEEKSKKARCESYRFIEHAAIVLNNQIQIIEQELGDAESQINSSLQEIGASIGIITQSAKGENEADRHNLVDAMREVSKTITLTEEFSKNAFEDIAPMRSMASNVTEVIASLSAQLHLIGLNAEVHAAQAGGSSGLESISSKTSEISIETKNLCGNVSKSLDDLLQNLNDNVSRFEFLHQNAADMAVRINGEMPVQEKNLASFETEYSSSNKDAATKVKSLAHLVQSKAQSMNLKQSMIKELKRLRSLNNRISEAAKRNADSYRFEVDIPKLLEGLLSRYTMNAEKSAHMSALGIAGKISTTESTDFAVAAINESETADIEFFEFEPKRETDCTSAVPEEEKKKNNTLESGGFGDNIELF
ncbi:MAG: hypothetical protein F6K21_29680 [Symploca sp. SIO2D2]|nr:hypothetical protein [Symploca sp. SIO2D2]